MMFYQIVLVSHIVLPTISNADNDQTLIALVEQHHRIVFTIILLSMVSHRGHNCISSALTILDSAFTS